MTGSKPRRAGMACAARQDQLVGAKGFHVEEYALLQMQRGIDRGIVALFGNTTIWA